jgi:ferrous iron transport protein A
MDQKRSQRRDEEIRRPPAHRSSIKQKPFLTVPIPRRILKDELQMTFKKRNRTAASQKRPATLAELRNGEEGILDRLDLPDDIARRLMELGFLPGNPVIPARTAPGGGARVFRVDGSEIALRDDTASRLFMRLQLTHIKAVTP